MIFNFFTLAYYYSSKVWFLLTLVLKDKESMKSKFSYYLLRVDRGLWF